MEQSILLIFIRTVQSEYIEINDLQRWIKENVLTWRLGFRFIFIVWAREMESASWTQTWNSPKIPNTFSLISEANGEQFYCLKFWPDLNGDILSNFLSHGILLKEEKYVFQRIFLAQLVTMSIVKKIQAHLMYLFPNYSKFHVLMKAKN